MAATKYQVFVSSTYEDLRKERDQVIKAVLELGHIPVGMEMFSADDEEQWKIIARHIDESDYYCVIVAHRYGSQTAGISYTRKEYEYAISRGIPALGFVIDPTAEWHPKFVDTGSKITRQLEDFKSLVKSKPVSFWRTADDLYAKFSIALSRQITANPRDGWVRASAAAGPELVAELARLSAESARYREIISNLEQQARNDHSDKIVEAWTRLSQLKASLSYKYDRQEDDWQTAVNKQSVLFAIAAPELAAETNLVDLSKNLAMSIREDPERPWWTVAQNQTRDLLANWMALRLVEPSNKRHQVSDTNEYWMLTAFGREVMAHQQLERMGVSPPDDFEIQEPTERPDVNVAIEVGEDTDRSVLD